MSWQRTTCLWGGSGEIRIKTDDVKMKTNRDSDGYVVRNTVLSGGQSGWLPPRPELITVVQGTATFYDGDVHVHVAGVPGG